MGGYQWHYVDGVSDDGATAIVVIALVGSPFSAAYARDRSAPAESFCAMNVAVYDRRGGRFSLTERALGGRDAGGVSIGASTMRRDGSGLVVDVDERSTPWGAPIRGRIRLHPECAPGRALALDEDHLHRWWPIAPVARIEVDLSAPALRFRGHGYHDANAGDVPLEATFDRWSWSRARLSGGRAAVIYDCVDRRGEERRLARILDRRGARELVVGGERTLPGTLWGLGRTTRADAPATVVRTLEDGPFYARSLVRTRLAGEDVIAMHEELSCTRLAASWVRFLTGFRMRRT